MRYFNYRTLEQAKIDTALLDYRNHSADNRSTIYLDSLDENREKFSTTFGENFKFGLERKFRPAPENRAIENELERRNSSTEDLKKSLDDGFTRMSYDISNKERYTEECMQILKNGESTSFYLGSELIGLILTTPFAIENESKTLIAWMWINSKSNLEHRKKAKNAIYSKIEEINTASVAAVHNRNIASMSFLENIGFKRFCIIC
ncbi:hypothetical protein [Halobacteriovorax sp. HLS]|uniref:hypothetical protein n=1 Tax=Halobacteriovorax sp. HLS TaxID=2234000 RepID=UPI000FD7FF1F|nr:hypothetical protein [Halobacteriovorax sp. HLS]